MGLTFHMAQPNGSIGWSSPMPGFVSSPSVQSTTAYPAPSGVDLQYHALYPQRKDQRSLQILQRPRQWGCRLNNRHHRWTMDLAIRVISPSTDAPMAAIDGGPCNAVLSTSAIPSHHGCEVRQGAVCPAIPQCPGRDRDGAICQPDTANAKGLGDHHMGGATPGRNIGPPCTRPCDAVRSYTPLLFLCQADGDSGHHPIHHRTPSIDFPCPTDFSRTLH